jgi:hypothetical protein
MLHGTWGIEENEKGIRVATIRGHGHHIVAGNRDNPTYQLDPMHPPDAGHDMDHKHDHPNPGHDQMEEYTLEGVPPGDGTQRFNADQNAIVEGSHHAKDVAVLIHLKHPREIHSVRRARTNGRRFFENGIPLISTEIAVTQVLVYHVKDLAEVVLKPMDGREGLKADQLDRPDGNSNVVNLHVFASPRTEEGLPKTHFIEVFQALAAAFGFVISPLEKDRPDEEQGMPLDRDMTPLKMLDVPPHIKEDIAGLHWRDTVSLHELRPRPAVSPANCNMVVFKNHV